MKQSELRRGLDSFISIRSNLTPFRNEQIRSPSFFIQSNFRNNQIYTNNVRSSIRKRLSTQQSFKPLDEPLTQQPKLIEQTKLKIGLSNIMEGLRQVDEELRKNEINKLGFSHQIFEEFSLSPMIKKKQKLNEQNNKQLKIFDIERDSKQLKEEEMLKIPQIVFGSVEEYKLSKYSQISKSISIILNYIGDFIDDRQISDQEEFNNQNLRSEIHTFDENVAEQVKSYKCKYCPSKFVRACSLGGHISRVHKELSMQQKMLKNKKDKNNLNKKRIKVIKKNIIKFYNPT